MPYISASIILQLMTAVSPHARGAEEGGRGGRKKINQYTRYLTVVLAAFQASASPSASRHDRPRRIAVDDPGMFFRVSTVVTIAGGTHVPDVAGRADHRRGIGNGISLIIFVGIVADLPHALASTARARPYRRHVAVFIVFLIWCWRSRSIAVHRLHGARAAAHPGPVPQAPAGQPHVRRRELAPAAEAEHLGRHPGDLRQLAAAAAGDRRRASPAPGGPDWLRGVIAALGYGRPLTWCSTSALIIFFSFFYTSIVFNPQETAENLRKYGGFVPGYRPGERTAEYLDYVLTRLTVVGALYLAAVCVLPEILISQYGVPFYFGGTSLLIVVSVTMDTVAQIQSHLIAHQYEGLIKKARLRGRRG